MSCASCPQLDPHSPGGAGQLSERTRSLHDKLLAATGVDNTDVGGTMFCNCKMRRDRTYSKALSI